MATLNLQVAASTDDFGRWWLTSYWNFESATIYPFVGYQGSNAVKAGTGQRFLNVTIPKGATIVTAYLTFTCRGSTSADTVNSKIKGEAADNAATFVNEADFLTRSWTTAVVSWNAIPAWTLDTEYNSPEIKTIIQEIVNRAGWASGNAMVLLWEDFDGNTVGTADRRPYSYDGSTTKCAKLHIEYTVQYDETAKLQVVLAAQGKTDTQAMVETALQVVLASQGEVDIQTMLETAKLQVALAVQGEADGWAYNELGLLQVILAAQGEAESLTLGELGREQVILAVLSEADIQTMLETALQVVLAAQGITATQAMLETAKLQVLLAAQGEADASLLSELGKEQVILAVLGEADQYGFIETGKLQVILAQIGISTVFNLQKVRLQGAVRNLPSVRELEAL